jgi:hypothetical protein
MNEIKKLRDNLYMCDMKYFTSMEEINKYLNLKLGVSKPKTDEEVLEQMDIKVIENFLRKKKLEILNKK